MAMLQLLIIRNYSRRISCIYVAYLLDIFDTGSVPWMDPTHVQLCMPMRARPFRLTSGRDVQRDSTSSQRYIHNLELTAHVIRVTCFSDIDSTVNQSLE